MAPFPFLHLHVRGPHDLYGSGANTAQHSTVCVRACVCACVRACACVMSPNISPSAILRRYGVNPVWSDCYYFATYATAGIIMKYNYFDLKLVVRFHDCKKMLNT